MKNCYTRRIFFVVLFFFFRVAHSKNSSWNEEMLHKKHGFFQNFKKCKNVALFSIIFLEIWKIDIFERKKKHNYFKNVKNAKKKIWHQWCLKINQTIVFFFFKCKIFFTFQFARRTLSYNIAILLVSFYRDVLYRFSLPFFFVPKKTSFSTCIFLYSTISLANVVQFEKKKKNYNEY